MLAGPTTTHPNTLGAPVLDNLGFHTDRDYRAELDTLQHEIDTVTKRVQAGFGSYEERHNTYSHLDTLQRRAQILTGLAAVEDQEMNRLETAIRTVGDPDLGFIAYVVYGARVLPMETRYEVRLVERRGGYSVPGLVRRYVTADQLADVERELRAEVMKRDGHAALWGNTAGDYRVSVLAY
jgi:hypothetical protein